MTPGRLSTVLCGCLDALALGALASTGENLGWVIGVAAAAGIWIAARGTRIARPLLIAWLIAGVITGAVIASLASVAAPLIVAACAAPMVHIVIWLIPEEGRKTPPRLCLGLVELVMAASLSTEFHLFLMIFAFVVVGGVATACHFLASELRLPGPKEGLEPGGRGGGEPLPRGFVPRIFGLSLLTFLGGLVLFPILPRTRGSGRMSLGMTDAADITRIGYTEDLSLANRLNLSGPGSSGSAVLWLYPRSAEGDISDDIFLGLIRGKALGRFDGTRWSATADARSGARDAATATAAATAATRKVPPSRFPGLERVVIDAVRDPLGSSVLPVPYGTVAVSGASPAIRLGSHGEGWMDPPSVGERSSYTFEFVPFHLGHQGGDQDDRPLEENLYVPPSLRTERMERLARQIFGEVKTAKEKADRLMGFFHGQGFSASFGDSDPGSTDNLVERSPMARRLHRLERFLFLDRKGYCELFASSSAILLRLGGVPTRLVAGFRLTHGPVGGVLTIRSDDAHAWIEYWDPERGWMPLDPTPRVLMAPGWLGVFRDGYDWVSGYWYRYVLSFQWKPRHLSAAIIGSGTGGLPSWVKGVERRGMAWVRGHGSALLALAALLLLLIPMVYFYLLWRHPWILSIRHRVREGHPRLRQERRKMERWLARRSSRELSRIGRDSEPAARALRSWRSSYLRMRFGGPAASTRQDLALLRSKFRRVRALSVIAGRTR